MDAGTGSHGIIKITDTSQKTVIDSKTYYQVTQYNRIYNPSNQTYTIEVRKWVSNVTAAPVAATQTLTNTSSTTFDPTTGWRYVYVTGQTAVNRDTYIYGTSSWEIGRAHV